MNQKFLEKNIQSLVYQRNILSLLTVLLTVCVVTQSFFLFSKRERIVIVPPVVNQEFWVESGSVSATYLEQMGFFLASLALGKSAESSKQQSAVLLRHTSPQFAGVLKKRLIEEQQKLNRENASYVFFPVSIKTDPNEMKVTLNGDRILYVSGKELSKRKESYTLLFKYSGGRVLLNGIEAKEQPHV